MFLLIFVCSQGEGSLCPRVACPWGGGGVFCPGVSDRDLPPTSKAAGGTYPIGMHLRLLNSLVIFTVLKLANSFIGVEVESMSFVIY